jgi:hypothetical protein
MGVTRWLLRLVTWIWFVLAGLSVAAFVFDLPDMTGAFGDISVIAGSISALVIPLSTPFAFALLSFSARRDLKYVPEHVREHFRFRYLGILGWLGVTIILGGLLYLYYSTDVVWNMVVSGNMGGSEIDYDHIGRARLFVEHITYGLNEALKTVWLGALCLYARYRIAANKGLAAASDH